MSKQITISSMFPAYLFWDVDFTKLNARRDKSIIIPRALFMTDKGSFDTDIIKLEAFYSPAQIIEQLKGTKERISNEVCELVAIRYSIPHFYRYKPKQ